MGPSWQYCAFFISWIQCSIVVWLAVTIETQSTNAYSDVDNSTTSSTAATLSLLTFSTIVMPTCPPPNKLHLLCDVSLAAALITCKERADVVRICWTKFGDKIYNNSDWSECKNSCENVVYFLGSLGFISGISTTTPLTTTGAIVTVVPLTTPIKSSASSTTHSSASNTSSISSYTKAVTPATNTTGSITTISDIYTTIDTPSSMAGEGHQDTFPPLSYVYPLFGGVCILIEVVVLCYIFCYRNRKKKQGSPGGPYRRTSTGSMVIHEEMVEAETTSPTQALCNGPGPGFNDEMVLEEDRHIFRSYLNLRYIDDTSAEGTPEKVTVT